MSFPESVKNVLQQSYCFLLRSRISLIRGVTLGDGVIIKGMPIIDTSGGGEVYIGSGATLNSLNFRYHINMHSPVKLMADRKGAQIRIGAQTRIHGTCIHAYKSVTIGEKCLIAANCQIMDCNGHDLSFDNVENRIHTTGNADPVVIEDCVWIGANAVILSGVRVGRGSIIGAGSVVGQDIPPMVVACGNPAKPVKRVAPSESLVNSHVLSPD
jgi:acetyltransferase-like isoleucine patch superfamily enzyme